MTESDLDLLVSQFLEGIRRAFSEVGKKDAAAHSRILEYLNTAIAELDKIRRGELPKHEDIAEAKALDDKLRDYIDQASVAGPPDKNKILKKIQMSPTTLKLVAQRQHALVERGLAELVGDRIERKKRTDAHPEDERQLILAFHNIEEFRSVPRKIAYVDPDTGQPTPIPYVQSSERHRLFSIAQRKRDWKVEEEANRILEPLVKLYGDIPPPELMRNKLRDDKKQDRDRRA